MYRFILYHIIMKKYFSLWIMVLCCIFINNINFSNAYCSPYQSQYYYNECIKKEENYNYWLGRFKTSDARGDYVGAVNSLEQMKKYTTDRELIDNINSRILNYSNLLWDTYFSKGNYSESIKYYKKSLSIYESPTTLTYIWLAYSWLKDFDTSLYYLKRAKEKSLNLELDEVIDFFIEVAEIWKKYAITQKNRKTNDKFGFTQYYMLWINIFDAWDKLPNNSHKVTVAVIDDGVSLNHPDLVNKIWVNKKETPWDWIDNDKNWYIDDYNGWDFNMKQNFTLPSDSHWTMVAGIMAANTDNVIWIAWIVPNIEIMPLKVFWFNWETSEEIIIDAINYAIENGANIINLSLGKHQFTYDNKFNDIFKKAYDKWIVVVIAAWNGDLLSMYSDWVNTSVNKVSPVCNESSEKMIIWVWALDAKWNKAKWSNYWSCVDFYMYWEDIYSTTISAYSDSNDSYVEPYKRESWTSFSAPIVAWIIWLWYNKFWKLKPDVVYANLKKSLNWNVIDAAKYLDNLSISQWELWKAIKWLITNKFTKATNASDFKYSNWITRAEAAKFFVIYAKLFKKDKRVNSDDKCKFSDLGKAPVDLRSYMINACRYWLLGWSKWKFMPNSKLTNAQAVTVFMRMYWWKKDENWNHYADRYFIDAYKLWLIDWMVMWKQKNYEKGATRWDMAILLYRWSKLMKK